MNREHYKMEKKNQDKYLAKLAGTDILACYTDLQ